MTSPTSSAQPLVTVVMPTFNWATVLPYSIASSLGQTMGDFELLIVGDGCTDESAEVVQAIGHRDPRVRWINLPVNAGSQAAPNNEGLRQARGKYVAYLGHDDLWLPDHLKHLVAAAESGAPIAHALQLRIEPARAPFFAPHREWAFKPGAWISPTSAMHRTEHGRAVGGWRLPGATAKFDPETDLWARMARHFGAPVLIDHVTSIKFSAANRRNVYKLRPCHEQVEWTRRILQAPDPEQAAREALRDPVNPELGPLPKEMSGPLPEAAVDRHALRRRIKGLEG